MNLEIITQSEKTQGSKLYGNICETGKAGLWEQKADRWMPGTRVGVTGKRTQVNLLGWWKCSVP